MTEQHLITPPPELVEQWRTAPEYVSGLKKLMMVTMTEKRFQEIAAQAARWGADQELEACCEHLKRSMSPRATIDYLRASRRPKSPSLKEQALQALENADGADHPVVATVLTADQHALIRKALEKLDD